MPETRELIAWALLCASLAALIVHWLYARMDKHLALEAQRKRLQMTKEQLSEDHTYVVVGVVQCEDPNGPAVLLGDWLHGNEESLAICFLDRSDFQKIHAAWLVNLDKPKLERGTLTIRRTGQLLTLK